MLVGISLAFILDLPPSGIIILTMISVFFVFYIFRKK